MSRSASIERNTSETKIKLSIDLDGNGNGNIHTGIGFFVGIVLGEAIKQAVGDKKGIKRYGSFMLPMDETLMLCAIDLSGRPYFVMDCDFTVDRVGEFDTEMVREFFYAVSYGSMMNLHLKKLHGENNHHMIEAAFKAFAKALDEATSMDPRITDVLSTKGAL